ncbi:MAG: energy transducer TonB, partial [Bdellovibrio sp.]|nr:energy transducer TonB [Bdellovibrio sp.]
MKKSPSFKKYVLLSLAVHILVVAGLFLFETLHPEPPKSQNVSIDLITPEDLQKMAQAEALQKKLEQMPANQVVEQSENSINETEPVDSRFLSAKNQTVTKQTIAKERGEFQNVKKSAPKVASGPKGDGKTKSTEKPATEEQKEKIARELFKNFDASEALERQKVADRKAKIDAGQGEGRGNGEDVAQAGGDASKSNDYVKDVDQGLETMLNTREFKYYS